jgi:hypothetical protein
MHSEQARSRILGTLTGKWQRDAPFFTQSGLHTDSIFGQVRDATVQVGQLEKDLGLEASSLRHAARLIIVEIMRSFFPWFKGAGDEVSRLTLGQTRGPSTNHVS